MMRLYIALLAFYVCTPAVLSKRQRMRPRLLGGSVSNGQIGITFKPFGSDDGDIYAPWEKSKRDIPDFPDHAKSFAWDNDRRQDETPALMDTSSQTDSKQKPSEFSATNGRVKGNSPTRKTQTAKPTKKGQVRMFSNTPPSSPKETSTVTSDTEEDGDGITESVTTEAESLEDTGPSSRDSSQELEYSNDNQPKYADEEGLGKRRGSGDSADASPEASSESSAGKKAKTRQDTSSGSASDANAGANADESTQDRYLPKCFANEQPKKTNSATREDGTQEVEESQETRIDLSPSPDADASEESESEKSGEKKEEKTGLAQRSFRLPASQEEEDEEWSEKPHKSSGIRRERTSKNLDKVVKRGMVIYDTASGGHSRGDLRDAVYRHAAEKERFMTRSRSVVRGASRYF